MSIKPLPYLYIPCQSEVEINNKKTVVLIHGLFGSAKNLTSIARKLSDNFEVYALDLPNHGNADTMKKATLYNMASHLFNQLDQLSIGQVYIMGHSLGGKVAMTMALHYPERVKKLCVADISPVAYLPRHDDIFHALFSVDLTQLKDRKTADENLKQYINEQATRALMLQNLKKGDKGFSWRFDVQALSDNYQHFIAEVYQAEQKYSQPVLFIGGGKSDYILADHQTAIKQLFPNAQYREIPDTGHWLHAEKPEVFSALVSRFFLH